MKRNRLPVLIMLLLLLSFSPGLAQRSDFTRTPISVPDILGYTTLKCDFHMHSVFSDGNVWPTVRVEEAWAEGLDAISITDHIEYQPHKDYVTSNHNSSYEIARRSGNQSNIMVIKGSEVTRSMPPGHLNAIFITDSAPLDGKDWREALEIAHQQGGFIFWNHPCWTGQQPDGIGRWYEEHSEIFAEGMLQGIEVVNSANYCPEAHQWAIDKNLTLLATSDIHPPIHRVYDIAGGDHRPITLVFSRDRSMEGIRDALKEQRTALLNGQIVIGKGMFLKEIFRESLEMITPQVVVKGDGGAYVQIRNKSDIGFHLVQGTAGPDLGVEEELDIGAGKTAILRISGRENSGSGKKTVPVSYVVENMWTAPGESLAVTINIDVDFQKE